MTEEREFSIHISGIHKPRIVLKGGGFGGFEFAKKRFNQDGQLVIFDLISRRYSTYTGWVTGFP